MKNKRNKRIKKTNKLRNGRVLFVVFGISLFAIYVLFKLFDVAIIKGAELKKDALSQWTKSYSINNTRGEILDSEGTRLAFNIPVYSVWLNPNTYKGTAEDGSGGNKNKEKFVQEVAEVFDLDTEDILKILEGEKRTKIVQWAPETNVEEIRNLEDFDTKGLEIEERERRFYPDGFLYDHILGFTDIDQNGLSGVELTMNDSLFGEPQRVIKMTDMYNKILPFSEVKTFGGDGRGDVILTVSDKIQRIADREALRAKEENNAKSVSVIVMDPTNGDILAMTDTNKYDNNNPRAPRDEAQAEEWKDKTNDEMIGEWQKNWNNLNVNVLYEPGSTFKTVTLSAAIEEGLADDSTDLYCNGAVTDIPGIVLRCVRWQNPHGKLDITHAYSESCNVAFIQIARKLGREKFLKYIKAYGFGEKSGVDLNGEQSGIIPQTVLDMTPATLATVSYGQGIASTNIQSCMAMSAAVNGGYLLKPRIVKEIRSNGEVIKRFPVEIRRKVISKRTSDKMREIMEVTVNENNKLGRVEGFRVGGKSGTAMVPDKGKYLKDKYIASFVGVAPIDDPKVLVFVSVEEPGNGIPYGGTIAGPVSSRIMSDIFPILGIKPSTETTEEKEEVLSVPDIMGMSLKDAAKLLNESKVKFRLDQDDIKENSIVEEVNPAVGSYIGKDDIVLIEVKNLKPEEEVPNFKGLTIDEAKELAKSRGIKINTSGKGKCVKQTAEPGSEIKDDMRIDLVFEEE